MNILGISCYYHDSAAALIINGKIIAAAQEERFTRKKHDPSFPAHSIEYCLKQASIQIDNIDVIGFYDKPFLKFERLLESYLAFAPKGVQSAVQSLPVWIKEKLWIKEDIKDRLGYSGQILFPEHHESHAASAFFPSPFNEAAILTMDGVGEWATSSAGIGRNNNVEILFEQHFPHSLGLLYSAFTYYTGFRVNSGEYKLMGLAPYGQPKYTKKILDELVDLKKDGSFHLNQDYFNYCAGLTMTNHRFNRLFEGKPRKPESRITEREMDLAASVQQVTEEVILRSTNFIKKETGCKNLCLAGGVALNCVANGKIIQNKIFDDIWIQPAAGDAGGALGAALVIWFQHYNNKRDVQAGSDSMMGGYLGPGFSDEETKLFLENNGYSYSSFNENDLVKMVAKDISEGKVVGWFQGRMEFGPRALGNRSILGDPMSPDMQKKLNVKIKFRESFRPFAPSVLEEYVSDCFDLIKISPYMLIVAPVSDNKLNPKVVPATGFEKLYQIRSKYPAITHVDNSARIQTVSKEINPRYHKLISEFHRISGCPMLINTSFNVRGEPIVCTPEEAYKCFMRTNMDVLVLGNYVLLKNDQPDWVEHDNWKSEYQLD